MCPVEVSRSRYNRQQANQTKNKLAIGSIQMGRMHHKFVLNTFRMRRVYLIVSFSLFFPLTCAVNAGWVVAVAVDGEESVCVRADCDCMLIFNEFNIMGRYFTAVIESKHHTVPQHAANQSE